MQQTNKICNYWKTSYRPRPDRGFGAALAVVMISIGTLALSLAALSAAIIYSDSVNRNEWRIQAGLNRQACDDMKDLVKSKDMFVAGAIKIPEFDCSVSF
ncbi:MAG: hypothetical protein NT077_02395 [Candidatus Taylorbacteria bacterium]|nr:hypothetical protein [Candidatus Taylorbacteria bacterium]